MASIPPPSFFVMSSNFLKAMDRAMALRDLNPLTPIGAQTMPSPARPVAFLTSDGILVFRNVYSVEDLVDAVLSPAVQMGRYDSPNYGPVDRLRALSDASRSVELVPASVATLTSHVKDGPTVLTSAAFKLLADRLRGVLDGGNSAAMVRMVGRVVPSVLARRPDLWDTADARIEVVRWASRPVLGKGFTKVVTFA